MISPPTPSVRKTHTVPLDAMLCGLLVDCHHPCTGDGGCALHDVRAQPLRDRVRWLRAKSEREKTEIAAHCRQCLGLA
jgi:hypothetical protein